MKVNTTYWGEPLSEYWGYNERTGATDLNDPDFENYPPFIRNNMNPDYIDPLATTYTYTLRAAVYKEGGSGFEPNQELPDYSIAYIGVNNPDMPQCDIACLGLEELASSGSTRADECFITDRHAVAPIAFLSDRPMRSYRSVSTYTVPQMEFYNFLSENPNTGVPINGKRCYAPKFRDDATSWATRNTSFDCAYWRSLGLRTFFGVIYVRYCDYARNPSTGFPTKYDYAPVTLHWYEQQTREWREAHPICQAWLRMCIRRNTNGLYDFTHNPGDGIMPDLTQGLKVNPLYFPTAAAISDYKFCAPAVMFGDGNDFTDWPLFGHLNRDTPLGQFGANTSSGGASSGQYPMFIGYNFGSLQYGGTSGTGSNARTIWTIYEDHDDYEWFRQGAAAYGVFFTDGDTNDTGYEDLFAEGNDGTRWTHEKMCLGVVNGRGYTDGTYTRGADNPTARNYTWLDTTQSPFNPKGFNVYNGDQQAGTIYIGDQSVKAIYVGDQSL